MKDKFFEDILKHFYYAGVADGSLKPTEYGKPCFATKLNEFKTKNPNLFNKNGEVGMYLFSLEMPHRIRHALRDVGFDNNSTLEDLKKIDKAKFLDLKRVGQTSWFTLKEIAAKHNIYLDSEINNN